MQRLSGWELRQRAADEGYPVSGKQFADYVVWGLLPQQPEGGWVAADVDRLIQIRKLGETVRQMHRRVIQLRDLRWPTPPDKLRQAMIDTIPSIAAPARKMRSVYRAFRILFGDATPDNAGQIRVPADWRLPERFAWQELFRWSTETEFELLAGSVYSQAHALQLHPGVQASELLAGIPFEELVILLMTRQLVIGTTLRQFPLSIEGTEKRD
jgi:hypothetical protein